MKAREYLDLTQAVRILYRIARHERQEKLVELAREIHVEILEIEVEV